MFERARTWALRLLRVPAEPQAPWGAPESVRVFRAGRNFYKLRLIRWTGAQLLTLAGLVFWIVMLGRWERDFNAARAQAAATAARPAAVAPAEPPAQAAAAAAEGSTAPAKATPRRNRNPKQELFRRSPDWLFPLLRVLELIGLISYLAQIPFTYALLRLDYELRWYIVTDRSLRIRSGLWRVQEGTMSFANVQQVSVIQGPLQRWLRLADVRVQSAGGGGGGDDHARGQAENLHTGVFHAVENANEIRDLILERLRQFRAAGLGDPDDPTQRPTHEVTVTAAAAQETSTLAAAKHLLAEARALRQTLS